ncbi:hypothetical protein HY256_02975 [Candidatus Sumerlaeota bacterium]|nr:hypothetical protein [Candidatus Sumerlaeota bacterium]
MSKILALGTGPLLESGVRGFSAHCLRTWHFVKPLLDAGHEVRLYTLPISTGEPEKLNDPGVEERNYEGFRYRAFLNCDDGYNLRHLNEDCAAFAPDALLGVNSYPCAVISKISSSAPLWADLNGSVIIEAQAKAAIYGNNSMLGHYWDIEEAPLRRADRFSVVSMRQFYALHGELAAVGRLNRHTLAHSFAACIPNAFYPALADAVERERARGGKIGELADLPRNAFVLLWSGGYNSWTDVELLARALEQAMESCPDLHYVSTGGQIYGHDDLTYPRFEQLARQSKFCERFHLLGWVDADRIPAIWSRANLGLCVDSNNFETMFGARNRTVNMIASGVLVLTTLGAEISEELVKTNCALGCKLDDADDLARGIIKAYGRRDKLPELAARGRKHVLETYSYARTTEALLEWAKNPSRAPDNEFKINSAPAGQNPFLQATNPIEERLNRRAAHPYPPPAAKAGFIEPVKRALEGLIGNERYNKLRFLRREWMGHSRRSCGRSRAARRPRKFH